MNHEFKQTIWKQFGASIDMLANAITLCPVELWDTKARFWYNAYHCIFWLDYYLTAEPSNFAPPAPYTFSEFDPSGALPDRVYRKEELLEYIAFCRQKCHLLISGLTDETANKRWTNEYKDFSMFEVLLYNMRHVQHHAGQLNLLLRQGIDDAPRWVSQAKEDIMDD